MPGIILLRNNAVSVTYTGTTPIIVDPPLNKGADLAQNKTTPVDRTGVAYTFNANDQPIGSVWFRDDMDKVEIAGGMQVGGTAPFKVKVSLT